MSGSTTTNVTRKRKRVKLKCLVCGRAFDEYHRKDHNERFHTEFKRENRMLPFIIDAMAIIGATVENLKRINGDGRECNGWRNSG